MPDIIHSTVLRWAAEHVFWPTDEPYLQCTDQRFRFLNGHCFGKEGVLVVLVCPPFSTHMEVRRARARPRPPRS